MSGRVSRTLEADVLQFAGRHGLVVWLDREGHYTRFTDFLP